MSMKDIVRFLVLLAAPFILIFGGGGLVGLGLEHEIEFLAWVGAIAVVCGLLWGCWMFFVSSSSLWWD